MSSDFPTGGNKPRNGAKMHSKYAVQVLVSGVSAQSCEMRDFENDCAALCFHTFRMFPAPGKCCFRPLGRKQHREFPETGRNLYR